MLGDRVVFENPYLSQRLVAEAFRDAWQMKAHGWIDELEYIAGRGKGGRQRSDVPFDMFIQKILAAKRMPLYRFVEEDMFTGRRMFTVFVRFDDAYRPQVELFGWAYVPVDKAGTLIERYRLKKQ